jgi:RNA polymerase sigma-70 factor (sigma-E family)
VSSVSPPAQLADHDANGTHPERVADKVVPHRRTLPIGATEVVHRVSWSVMEREKPTASMETQRTASPLAELYVRSAPSAIRLAYLLTGDHVLAEDLVQEAFVRFVGRLHHLRDPEAFDAYLRRTVVNLSKNVFRRRAVERAYLEREAAAPRVDQRDEADIVAHEAMRASLLALPPRQRAAIVLRYYADLPDSEIADVLRCRPATVRSLVARGLERLRLTPEVTA